MQTVGSQESQIMLQGKHSSVKQSLWEFVYYLSGLWWLTNFLKIYLASDNHLSAPCNINLIAVPSSGLYIPGRTLEYFFPGLIVWDEGGDTFGFSFLSVPIFKSSPCRTVRVKNENKNKIKKGKKKKKKKKESFCSSNYLGVFEVIDCFTVGHLANTGSELVNIQCRPNLFEEEIAVDVTDEKETLFIYLFIYSYLFFRRRPAAKLTLRNMPLDVSTHKIKKHKTRPQNKMAQSVRAAEYTDCISAER